MIRILLRFLRDQAGKVRSRVANTAGGVGALACIFIGGKEGLELKTYRDSVGVPTVCYGETRGVRMGMVFTKPECDAKFITALDEFGEKIERCNPTIKAAPPKRYVAHLSLAYNIGAGAYCKSSVVRLHSAGHVLAACDFFMKFNRAGGMELRGLTKRRAEERIWCREAV